ncbi:PAAR domain-containing protein [Vibrio vulnificus]|uniref:PAAR domain-containing protein n=1 Tax=Vibrio vulnificus TaxID=672 RepID=UPI001F5F4B28|nr:PAAR domain-containing protein [Vibrio vulnificus]
MINGVPAARKGDSMVCVGPPDSIKQGSSSVFINGKPAARMFDSTNHGGVIIGGSPNVFIGDAGCYPDPQDSAVASSDSRLQSNEDKQVAPQQSKVTLSQASLKIYPHRRHIRQRMVPRHHRL